MSFFSRLFRSKPKLMTWQEFVEYFARRIQEELDLEAKIDWGENIASSPIIVQFSEDDEASFSTYLSNHYTSYLQNPEALEAIVAANLAVIDKIQDTDASVSAQQILPTIKKYDLSGKRQTDYKYGRRRACRLLGIQTDCRRYHVALYGEYGRIHAYAQS